MENQFKTGTITAPRAKHDNFYLWMNLFLALVLPVLSISLEYFFEHSLFGWQLVGKWFIFWAVGIRLFTAGVKQASNPEFTASKIFNFRHKESYVVIRELGFANMALGAMGILSVINDQWRLIAAISGGMFYLLAGVVHMLRKISSTNELIALVYDLFAALMLIFYLIFH
jgi:hypothetical protein